METDANPNANESDWNDAERRVERAQELFEQRKWAEALEELRVATSINPYNASWFFNIGLTLDELGRFDEAIEAYESSLAIEPQDVQALHHLGADLHQVGRFDEALRAFERIEKIDPAFEPCYCARILTYGELGEHEKAEEMFYLARTYKDHCDECFYNMGISLAARELYDRAIYCFTRTLDDSSSTAAADWPEIYFRIAKAYHAKGDLEQARRHYLTGLRHDPGDIESLLDLSELLIEMGRLDEAGEKIRRAIELAPEEPAAHYCHGRWLLRRDRLREAEAALGRALQLDPTCSGAHLQLGAVCLKLADLPGARRHLRSELLLRPEDPTDLHDLGNLLLDVGETRAAVACFKRLAQVCPHDATAWLNLGVAHFLRMRYEDGIACCVAALERDPRNVKARYNLALAHAKVKQFDEGLAHARAGLTIAPRDVALQTLEFRLRALRLRAGAFRIVRLLLRIR